MTALPPESHRTPDASLETARSDPPIALRILGALAGVVTLLFAGLFSLGAALAAPFGVLAARALAHRRSRRLTLMTSWLGAIVAAAVAVVILVGVLAALAPPGFWQTFRDAQATAQADAEPPEWLTRITPPQARQPDRATKAIIDSPAFTVAFGVIGVVLAAAMMGTIAGSMGWPGALLLGYAITGRWPSHREHGADRSRT